MTCVHLMPHAMSSENLQDHSTCGRSQSHPLQSLASPLICCCHPERSGWLMTDMCCNTTCPTCQTGPFCRPLACLVPWSRPRSAGCRTSSHTTRPGPHCPRPGRRTCTQLCLSRPRVHRLELANDLMYDAVCAATQYWSLLHGTDGPMEMCEHAKRVCQGCFEVQGCTAGLSWPGLWAAGGQHLLQGE